jgi:hypothetical protein
VSTPKVELCETCEVAPIRKRNHRTREEDIYFAPTFCEACQEHADAIAQELSIDAAYQCGVKS